MVLKKTLLKYVLVGGLAYVLEMAALQLMLVVAGLGSTVAVGISFWIGFFTAFFMQKLITFNSNNNKKRVVGRQLILYSILVAFNYSFTMLVVSLLSNSMSVFVIRSCVIGLATVWNFVIYKSIIFKDRELQRDDG